jgi:hypothetical protein
MSTLLEDLRTFMIIARLILLSMRNIREKSCTENQNMRFVLISFSKIVPFMKQCGKILYSRAGHRRQYGACALRAR